MITEFETKVLYIGVWAVVGSILGFLSFTYNPNKNLIDNSLRCFLSVGLGLFIAFPVYTFLSEKEYASENLSIMISGLSALGLPDFLLKYYPVLARALTRKAIKTIDNKKLK